MAANPQNRAGFTLVELLTVIVIISMLIGLLVPAVLASRSRAQTTQCINRQGELGKALIAYDLKKRRLPGAINRVTDSGGATNDITWATELLPFIGRNDLWEDWRDGTGSAVLIDVFCCPSDYDSTSNARLCYVVNDDLCRNLAAGEARHSLADLRSSANLILLSERPDSGREWSDASLAYDRYIFDWLGDNSATIGSRKKNFVAAHPFVNSGHAGGVVVTLCDGSVQFLSDQTEAGLYREGL